MSRMPKPTARRLVVGSGRAVHAVHGPYPEAAIAAAEDLAEPMMAALLTTADSDDLLTTAALPQ